MSIVDDFEKPQIMPYALVFDCLFVFMSSANSLQVLASHNLCMWQPVYDKIKIIVRASQQRHLGKDCALQ